MSVSGFLQDQAEPLERKVPVSEYHRHNLLPRLKTEMTQGERCAFGGDPGP